MATCITPFAVRNKSPYGYSKGLNWTPVPCGKCPVCRQRRSDGWIFRLNQQRKISKSTLFVTLTYSDENLPRTPNNLPTLDRSDLRNFFKRLRKMHGRTTTLKYYACGEYGSRFARPHYHIILFNAVPRYVQLAWTLKGNVLGKVDVQTPTKGAIAYVTGYVMKPQTVPLHERDDRLKEYSVMSKGLGANYINQRTQNYHAQNPTAVYLTENGGKKLAMPRYYKEKIYDDEMRETQKKFFSAIAEENERTQINEYVQVHGSEEGFLRQRNERRANAIRQLKLKDKRKF